MKGSTCKSNSECKTKLNKRMLKRADKQLQKEDSNKENDLEQLINIHDLQAYNASTARVSTKPARKGLHLSQQTTITKSITKDTSREINSDKKPSDKKTSQKITGSENKVKLVPGKRFRNSNYKVVKDDSVTISDISPCKGIPITPQQLQLDQIITGSLPQSQTSQIHLVQEVIGGECEFECNKERQNILQLESLTLSEKSERYNEQQPTKNDLNPQSTPFGFLDSTYVSPQIDKSEDQQLKSDEKLSKNKLQFHLYAQQTFDSQTLQYLVERDEHYKYDKDRIFKNQSSIKPFMREMLIDWMMEVSDEFKLKRQTFHLSVYFIDKYLAFKDHMKLEKFQLLGATSLLVASKIEEIYCPRVKDFELATDSGFNEDQILKMERRILTRLQWMANPTTINAWANIYMQRWDLYQEQNSLGLSILDPRFYSNKKVPMFKSDYNEDYVMFRVAMQVIDYCLLDLDYMKHDPRHMALASIIITLGLTFNLFNRTQVSDLGHPQTQNFLDVFLNDPAHEYSNLAVHFCETQCSIKLADLRGSFKFICQFFIAEPQLQLPSCLKDQTAQTQEEFYSFQIHYRGVQDTMHLLRKNKMQQRV